MILTNTTLVVATTKTIMLLPVNITIVVVSKAIIVVKMIMITMVTATIKEMVVATKMQIWWWPQIQCNNGSDDNN